MLQTLRESIKRHNVDTFHRHLHELERVLQSSERIKKLLTADGTLCYAAFIGSDPMVETLIQKGVGKKHMLIDYNENLYEIYNLTNQRTFVNNV